MAAETIQCGDINTSAEWNDESVPKITLIKTEQLAIDIYYMKPGQKLGVHRHPQGDQIFTVIEGTGAFELDGERVDVKPGSAFLAPANVWHDLENTGSANLVAQQVTKQPAGMEWRDK